MGDCFALCPTSMCNSASILLIPSFFGFFLSLLVLRTFECCAQGGARLAAGLLQRLGVKQAVVVGHSAGGLTALELHRRCAFARAPHVWWALVRLQPRDHPTPQDGTAATCQRSRLCMRPDKAAPGHAFRA